MDNKRQLIFTLLVFGLVMIISSITFAYYVIMGVNENEEVTLQTGTLSLTFEDGSNSFQGELEFGGSAEKTFKITNTGTLDALAKISWQNLINTYTKGSLTFSLSYAEEENGTYISIVTDKQVPISLVEETYELANELFIPSEQTYYYKLTITLNYLESTNQTSDLNAVLSTNFVLKEGKIKTASEKTLEHLNLVARESTPDFSTTAPIVLTWKDARLNALSTSVSTTTQSRYFTYSDSYTFDSNTGLYTLINPKVCKYSSCFTTLRNKYVIYYMGNSSSTPQPSSNLSYIYKIESNTSLNTMYYSNYYKTGDTLNVSKDGLYPMEDDYGMSYFFRGAVENNYVKFAGFYWRIIRINGDGSLRIQYDGTMPYKNGVSDDQRLALTNIPFNTNYNDNKYVGYMYSPSGTTASTGAKQAQTNTASSTIKTQLETWYSNNILNRNLDDYVADVIYCNDRSIPGTDKSGWNTDTGLGYGNNATAFGAFSRLIHVNTEGFIPTPILKCPQQNDAFTKNDKNMGNGALSQKVGLITADEIVLAGGKGGLHNLNYYLYKGATYTWSMTPNSSNSSQASMFASHYSFTGCAVYASYGAAPVISLTPEYVSTFIGDGSSTNPYRAKNEEI